VPATSDEQQVVLRVVSPTDEAWHRATAAQLAAHPDFWEDRMRYDPVMTYINTFANPDNFVLDVNGDGLLAFVRDGNGIRAWLYGISWGRGAMRIPTAWRVAATAAFRALGVARIEAIMRADNTLARRATEGMGLQYQGRIPEGLWYNREHVEGVWYEGARANYGVEVGDG